MERDYQPHISVWLSSTTLGRLCPLNEHSVRMVRSTTPINSPGAQPYSRCPLDELHLRNDHSNGFRKLRRPMTWLPGRNGSLPVTQNHGAH